MKSYLLGALISLVPIGVWTLSVTVDPCSPTHFRYCR